MFLSVFDMFKIGIGPSSSHTMGPMIAAGRFLENVSRISEPIGALRVVLHGSLAFTGKGHATDRAVILGLAGFDPEFYNPDIAAAALDRISSLKQLTVANVGPVRFDPASDVVFDYGLEKRKHANSLTFCALDDKGSLILQEPYYSIGGGFVLSEDEFDSQTAADPSSSVPFGFGKAEDLLQLCRTEDMTIAELMMANEASLRPAELVEAGLERIWEVMSSCIKRGLNSYGTLPGGLRVKRRAGNIRSRLESDSRNNAVAPHVINDWISVYAMAVNEENANGGQVVTAPTNGAAGVIPATIRYYLSHYPGASRQRIGEFVLTAAAVGGIIKRNASIAGAECGCQAEVGSASAMAAAGLCAVLDGNVAQVENAAEIALEHHLGLTCDPVGGLVQVPCIERNGVGAIKAVSAASLSLHGDGTHLVSLDSCIETMRQTGEDMSHKYKETSLGGLAVNLTNC